MPTPTLVLLTVNDHETDALLDAFHPEGHETRGGVTYTLLGELAGLRIVHTISEMGYGSVGAAQQRSQQAINHWSPVALVAVGIAFGMDETKQAIGDVLVATHVQDYELGHLTPSGSLIPRGQRAPSADTWTNRLRHTNTARRRAEPDWPKVRFGVMLSGQKLVDDLDYRNSLRAQFGETIGGEMEAQGVYVSATAAKVDWAVVKAICDWGNGKNHADKDAWQKLAARNAARVIKAALDLGPLYTASCECDSSSAMPEKHVSPPSSTPASSITAAVTRYRQAQITRLPGPMFFSPEARNLSQQERDTLFVDPLLREPVARRVGRSLRAPDHQPSPYRSPWSWSASLPSQDRPGLLLLGELGSGKSTALARLARHYCSSEDGLIPLFISLPRFADVVREIGSGMTLIQYAEDRAEGIAGASFQALDRARQFVWILDGLDEVLDPAVRGQVLDCIEHLRRGDGEPRFVVVGSRPQPDPQLSPNFIRRELAPWTEEHVETLVRRYHQAIQPGKEGEQRSDRLLRAFRTTPVLHELCQTPLLLALILSLGPDREVPWPRPGLYRETLRRVLDDDSGSKTRPGTALTSLSSEDKLAFLAHVAWDTLERRQLTIEYKRLVWLAAEWLGKTFAASARAGAAALVEELSQRGTIFVPGDHGHLEFALRAWCDYATALEICRRHKDDELPAVFATHWDDPLWTEPLVLTAGMLAERDPSAVVPSLHAVLRSRMTLEQWYLAQPVLFTMRALCYCPNPHRQPLPRLAHAITEFALEFDEDVGSGFAYALREAGPQWPAADELRRRAAAASLALAVCDVESRLAVLQERLLYTENYWDQLQMLAFARRIGRWTDQEVRQLLALPFPEQPDMGPSWRQALRVQIAVALLKTGPAPLALGILKSDLYAAAPELRTYAALALLSCGEVHTEALDALEVAVREFFWPEYIPHPMRIFLADAAEKCRNHLPYAEWQRIHTALSSSPSRPLRAATEVGPRRAPAPEQPFSTETHLRLVLGLPADAPLSLDTVPTLISGSRPWTAALALDAVATQGILPAHVWRSLGTELLAKYEAFYAGRSDWRGQLDVWRECDMHIAAVMDIATLLGDRNALRRIAEDRRIDESMRDFARGRLQRGDRLDMLLKAF